MIEGIDMDTDDYSQKQTSPERSSTLGRIWNIVVLVGLVAILAMSVNLAFNPSEATAHYPTWVNYVGYLVMVPLAAIGGAWVLMDKRRLVQRFPKLQRYSATKWLLMYIALIIVLYAIASLMGMVIGA